MNKFVKLALGFVLVIIVIGGLFYAKLFVIGNNNYQLLPTNKYVTIYPIGAINKDNYEK